jgi:hypothetical protein
MGRQKILNGMVASIPQIYSALNLFVNSILILLLSYPNVWTLAAFSDS